MDVYNRVKPNIVADAAAVSELDAFRDDLRTRITSVQLAALGMVHMSTLYLGLLRTPETVSS